MFAIGGCLGRRHSAAPRSRLDLEPTCLPRETVHERPAWQQRTALQAQR
jgi:hypothetical protein